MSSHGGHITVESSTASSLVLDFGGACEDCPAAGATLHDRIEATVRDRYPGLAEVTRVGGEHQPRGWLGLPFPGRGR